MSEYTSRERVSLALRGKKPDRVPLFDYLFSQKIIENVLGHKPDTYKAKDIVNCAKKLGLDATWIPDSSSFGFSPEYISEDVYKDERGITRKNTGASWPIHGPVDYPVKSKKDWEEYKLPDPRAEGRMKEIKTALNMTENGELSIWGGVEGPFTPSWMTVGLELYSKLLYKEPKFIHEITEAWTKYYIELGTRIIETGVDALVVSDDLGHTNGQFISKSHFDEFVLPYFRKMIREFKKQGVLIKLHSDGKIDPFLPDLFSLGIDAYHPVERSAGMDINKVVEKYGDGICVVGNVENKTLLVRGEPCEIREQVKDIIKIAGKNGGLILGSDHSLHDDIPIENVKALIKAAREFGDYPIGNL